MKPTNSVFKTAFVAVAVFTASSAFAQFTFDIPTSNGSVNFGATTPTVKVEGKVDFDFGAATVTFEVTNSTTFNSSITGAWLLKPFDDPIAGLTLSNVDPQVETNVNKRWKLATSVEGQTFNFVQSELGTADLEAKYFGAHDVSPSSDDVISSNPTETTTFTFSMPQLALITDVGDQQDFLDTYATKNSLLPQVIFRWQSLPSDINGGSAKGFGWFADGDIPITPVPEPSQIAALSMLGLGGLLFIRRRIKAKRATKA